MSQLPEFIPGLVGVFSLVWAKKRPLQKEEQVKFLARAIDTLPPEIRVWILELLIGDGDALKEDLLQIINGLARRESRSTNDTVVRFRERIEQECQTAHQA